jgi:hypothetical protein
MLPLVLQVHRASAGFEAEHALDSALPVTFGAALLDCWGQSRPAPAGEVCVDSPLTSTVCV